MEFAQSANLKRLCNGVGGFCIVLPQWIHSPTLRFWLVRYQLWMLVLVEDHKSLLVSALAEKFSEVVRIGDRDGTVK